MTAPGAARYVGVGAGRGVAEEEVLALVSAALAEAGGTVAALATVEAKAAEPGLVGAARRLGVALHTFSARELSGVRVPGGGSAAALAAVGTPSVAEAAALLAAGPGAQLLVGKRKSAPPRGPSRVTCAVAATGHHGAARARPSVIVVPPHPARPGRCTASQGDLVTTPPALLIAGHGDRDDGGAQALRALLDAVAERCPEVPAAAGFTGRAPSALPLADAVDGLAARGATEIVTVPLVSEGPARRGLSAEVTAAAARHTGLSFVRGQAPDGHPLLLGAWERTLDEALGGGGARRPRDRARTTVLLVGGGSGDPYANAEVARAARLLWEGRGLAGVETAFLSYAAPDVPAGLERCRVLGAAVPGPDAPGRIVVLPCFPMPGDEQERLRLQTEGWGAAHPESEVTCAEPVGAAPEVADAVVARYREAVRAEVEHRVAVR